MKKLKNKILISAIASVSSLAAIVAPLATTISTNNTSVLNSGLTAINYKYITFNTITDVTLTGLTKVKIKSGNVFGSVAHPTAAHASNYRFLGWSKVKGSSTKANMMTDTTKVEDNLQLWPIFEQAGIVITGDDVIKSSKSATYTANITSTGSKEPELTWTHNWIPSAESSGNPTVTPSADKKTATVSAQIDCMGSLELTVTDAITGKSATKIIAIEAPYVNSDKIWLRGTVKSGMMQFDIWGTINSINQFCDVGQTQLKIDLFTPSSPRFPSITLDKSSFDDTAYASQINLYIGDQVTSIPDNFMIGKTGTDGWSYSNITVNFPSTTKCTYIGKCFLQDCASWNKQLVLPNTIKSIDDGFLYGCEQFDNGVTDPSKPVALDIPTGLVNIGSDFMNGCILFNQNVTIPDKVTRVGVDFMANCNNFGYFDGYIPAGSLTINTDPACFETQEKEEGGISLTLSTAYENAPVYDYGIKIKGTYANKFCEQFPNRLKTSTSQTSFRRMSADKLDIAECSWMDIGSAASQLESGAIDTTAFMAMFKKNDQAITSMDDFIGVERYINFNNSVYKVRIIGTQHDTISQGETLAGKKAAFTFELTNVVGGFSVKWDAANNNDYTNSIMRATLTGSGTGTKASEKTALEMLEDENLTLASVIKKVNKHVAVKSGGTWSVPTAGYDDKLFLLTYTEMTGKTETGVYEEGSGYKYWLDNEAKPQAEAWKGRIKTNLAGDNQGYFVSSPITSGDINVKHIAGNNGALGQVPVTTVEPITFAFCI